MSAQLHIGGHNSSPSSGWWLMMCLIELLWHTCNATGMRLYKHNHLLRIIPKIAVLLIMKLISWVVSPDKPARNVSKKNTSSQGWVISDSVNSVWSTYKLKPGQMCTTVPLSVTMTGTVLSSYSAAIGKGLREVCLTLADALFFRLQLNFIHYFPYFDWAPHMGHQYQLLTHSCILHIQ